MAHICLGLHSWSPPQCPNLTTECACAWSLRSCVTLCSPVDCSPPGSSDHRFFRQDYWSRLPFPPPVDLPNSGIEPTSLASPALAGGFFTTCAIWKALKRGHCGCVDWQTNRGLPWDRREFYHWVTHAPNPKWQEANLKAGPDTPLSDTNVYDVVSACSRSWTSLSTLYVEARRTLPAVLHGGERIPLFESWDHSLTMGDGLPVSWAS